MTCIVVVFAFMPITLPSKVDTIQYHVIFFSQHSLFSSEQRERVVNKKGYSGALIESDLRKSCSVRPFLGSRSSA